MKFSRWFRYNIFVICEHPVCLLDFFCNINIENSSSRKIPERKYRMEEANKKRSSYIEKASVPGYASVKLFPFDPTVLFDEKIWHCVLFSYVILILEWQAGMRWRSSSQSIVPLLNCRKIFFLLLCSFWFFSFHAENGCLPIYIPLKRRVL